MSEIVSKCHSSPILTRISEIRRHGKFHQELCGECGKTLSLADIKYKDDKKVKKK